MTLAEDVFAVRDLLQATIWVKSDEEFCTTYQEIVKTPSLQIVKIQNNLMEGTQSAILTAMLSKVFACQITLKLGEKPAFAVANKFLRSLIASGTPDQFCQEINIRLDELA